MLWGRRALPATDAPDRKRARDTQEESPELAGRRSRVHELHFASDLDAEVARGDARWRNQNPEDKRGATKCPSLEGAAAAISVRPADPSNSSLGK